MTLTAELLERYHGVVKVLGLGSHYGFILALANHNSSISPAEIVHVPERVDGKEEGVNGITSSRGKTE